MEKDRHIFLFFAMAVLAGLSGLITARLMISLEMIYFISCSIFLPLLIAMTLPTEYSVITGTVGFAIFIPVVEHPEYGYANLIEVLLLYVLFVADGKFTECGKLPENAWEQCRPYLVNGLFSVLYILIHVSVMSEILGWNPTGIRGLIYDMSEKRILNGSINFAIWLLLMTAAVKIILYQTWVRQLFGLEKIEGRQYGNRVMQGMLFVISSYYLADYLINHFLYHKKIIYDHNYFYTAGGIEKIPLFLLGVFIIGDFMLFSSTENYLSEKKLTETRRHYQKIFDNMVASYEELETFSYLLSHEMKTPLREINAYADIIMEDNEGKISRQSMEDLMSIRKVCQDMLNLSDSMMQYSKVGYTVMNPRFVDMNALVGIILKSIKQSFPAKKFSARIEKLHEVYGDEFLLKQMVMNIIGNSVKFSMRQPEIRLEIWSVENEEKIFFYFQDHGIGFDQQDSGKLFQLFERLHNKKEFEGSGIGLAMVSKVVERHHGTVTIKGEPGKGCIVCAVFPKYRQEGKM